MKLKFCGEFLMAWTVKPKAIKHIKIVCNQTIISCYTMKFC